MNALAGIILFIVFIFVMNFVILFIWPIIEMASDKKKKDEEMRKQARYIAEEMKKDHKDDDDE